MVHKLETIAENFRLEKNAFIEFASKPENKRKFGVFEELGKLVTTTWYTDDLVAAFKNNVKFHQFWFNFYAWIPSYRDFDCDDITITAKDEAEAWTKFNERVKFVKSAGIAEVDGEKYEIWKAKQNEQ